MNPVCCEDVDVSVFMVHFYFPLTYLDRKSNGKTRDFWDKNPLQSSDILSETLFIENCGVVVKRWDTMCIKKLR